MRPDVACVICGENSPHYRDVDGYAFHACSGCGSIHVDPELIHLMDQGKGPVGKYEKDYWEQERLAAVERAAGLALCRAGEAILYCRRPVRRFLDSRHRPGLPAAQAALSCLIPRARSSTAWRSSRAALRRCGPGFHHGDLSELEGKSDAGVCIEVVEHLTPRMLEGIAAGLARVSQPDSLLFNTECPEYVQDDLANWTCSFAATSSATR
ncbi:MAG: hypothetical protein KIS72_01360 [Luteimonas sp.]|nr:hypothetical protein [Luteimonas sp.]